MASRPPATAAQAAVRGIADALERGAIDTLSESDLRTAAGIYVNEARKHAFRLRRGDLADERRQFGAHLRAAFADAPDPMVVIDWRDELAGAADRLASDGDPVAALILYVTWAEHWVTGSIAPIADRQGMSRRKRCVLLKDTFGRQLTWLQEALGNALNCAGDLTAAASLRHKLVHYTWGGMRPEALEDRRAEVRRMVAAFPRWTRTCLGYEDEHVTGEAAEDALRLFGVDPRKAPT